jgi:hypothetical protein
MQMASIALNEQLARSEVPGRSRCSVAKRKDTAIPAGHQAAMLGTNNRKPGFRKTSTIQESGHGR